MFIESVFGLKFRCFWQSGRLFASKGRFISVPKTISNGKKNRLTELENFVVMRVLGNLEDQLFVLCHLMVKDS